jgi:hypothetical protein
MRMAKKITLLKYYLVIVVLVTVVNANGQTKVSIASGSWEEAGTWLPEGVPQSHEHVVIANGHSVIIGGQHNATCKSLTIDGGDASTSLNISGPNTSLTVTNGITIHSNTVANRHNDFIIDGGTLNCDNILVNETQFDNINSIDIRNTATVTGNITMNAVSAGIINSPSTNLVKVLGSGRLNIGGAITGGTLHLNAGSVVNYNGTAAMQPMRPGVYSNLILSGSGSKTGTVSVGDTLCLAGTATAGNSITYSPSFSAVLEYRGSQPQTVTANEFPFNSLRADLAEIIINNPNGVTVNTPKTLNANLTLTSGTLTAGNNITIGTSTPGITRGEGSITGNLQGTSGSVYGVNYIGNSKQTGAELSGLGLTNVDINLTAGEILSLDQNRSPRGVVLIRSGIFDLGAFTFNCAQPSKVLAMLNGAVLKIGGTNSLPTGYTYSFTSGASTTNNNTVEYNGTSQDITVTNYRNLILSGIGDKTIAGNLSILGNLLVDSFARFSPGSNNLDMTSAIASTVTINGYLSIGPGRLNTPSNNNNNSNNNKTLILGNGGRLRTTNTGGFVLPVFKTYSFHPNSTVEYFASATQQPLSVAPVYGNLVLSGSGEKIIPGTGSQTLNVRGSLTIGAENTLNGYDRLINVGGDWINNGAFTFTKNLIDNNTVTLNGTSMQTIRGSANTAFRNLVINKTTAADGVILNQSITVRKNLSLQKGILFSSNIFLPTIQHQATITSASDSSFVDGPLRKIGNDDFTFPVGKAGSGYHQIGVDFAVLPTPTMEFTAQFFRDNPQTLSSTLAEGLKKISACEYWTLEGTWPARVVLSWENSSSCEMGPYVTNLSTLRVAHLNAENTWVNEGFQTGSQTGNEASGTIMSSNLIATFSPFALASGSPLDNPLPVIFGDVKAYEKKWSSANRMEQPDRKRCS